jgi:site-specific DNA recombinase
VSDTKDIRKQRSIRKEEVMRAAVGYIRVSTQEQAQGGVSLEMQIAKIRAYCDLNDLTLVGLYGDPGISGKTIKHRPGIQAVLNMVQRKRIDAVVIYKLDRLARNTVECLDVAKGMDKADVSLHSITERLDTQSALGRFFFTLIASLAEMERGIISERTKAALGQKRSKGEKTGGDCPYGYRSIDGVLVPDINEQQLITHIKALRGKGFSYKKIADALTEKGLFTRKETKFQPTQITRILKAAA